MSEIKEIIKTLGVLYKIRHFLNEKAVYSVFYSLFMKNRYGLLFREKAKKKGFDRYQYSHEQMHTSKNIIMALKNKNLRKLLHVGSLYLYELGRLKQKLSIFCN